MDTILKVGDVAPDFEALTDSGETVKLSDYRGQRVVLYFYPKDDTPGCTTQACGFRDRYVEIEERNAVVLGVSPDGQVAWKVRLNFFSAAAACGWKTSGRANISATRQIQTLTETLVVIIAPPFENGPNRKGPWFMVAERHLVFNGGVE